MQTLVNYALKYAEKGFYVLPIAAGDKRPLIEFADQPAMDAEKIERAWRRHPNAGIALRTVDFFVIDVDEHTDGADGKTAFREYAKAHRDLFPDTLKQTTGHGGWQFFYKKPPDCDMTQSIGWLPGVDVKAHINNYVVVAPSNGYKWRSSVPMAVAPPGLIKVITSKPKPQRDSPHEVPTFEQPTLSDAERKFGHSKTAELFEQIVNGLGETGGRNMALAAFIGGLLFRNVNVKAVYQLATEANEHTARPLDDREFDRTFDSMVKKEMRRRNGS
ncbi:bifunctional DNA primase/polymerase [Lactobacillus acetotolerans]|uniref:bifunctional DNA primase/polymerase n=1 Tax=Lactobacillus acetotolerans TaxID=1600 RepID=UPI002FDB269A